MSWDRKLWGVEFDGLLIGDSWNRPISVYDGEPSRALLFCTRQTARQWCAIQHAKYAGRTDCCAQWRFRPVRVRELVERANSSAGEG